MPGRHSLKRRKAESGTKGHRAEITPPRQRVVEVVDAHTLTAHFLTDAAISAGRHAAGRYIALCGQEVLPACLVEPGRSRCALCVARQGGSEIPVQRARP